MGIFFDNEMKVIVQGITGREGKYHTGLMLQYGTSIVAGCSPGKGGQVVNGVPVYDAVEEAVRYEGANTSIVFVPPGFAVDALHEAAEAGIRLIICITEGIPALDVMHALRRIHVMCPGTRIIGPNSPGIIFPGHNLIGIMPGNIFSPGKVGIISRSGTLTYQIAYDLTNSGAGQSSVIGVGGDPFIGMKFIDLLKLYNEDPDTEAVCLIGEIGGNDEEEAAEYIKNSFSKPVVAYVAGQTAPAGKKMGHAGAIISASTGTADSKIKALQDAGAIPVTAPYEAADAILKIF